MKLEKLAGELSHPLYRDKRTARFATGERIKEFQLFEEQAKKGLVILQNAISCYIYFEWRDNHPKPFNIEMVDYH